MIIDWLAVRREKKGGNPLRSAKAPPRALDDSANDSAFRSPLVSSSAHAQASATRLTAVVFDPDQADDDPRPPETPKPRRDRRYFWERNAPPQAPPPVANNRSTRAAPSPFPLAKEPPSVEYGPPGIEPTEEAHVARRIPEK
ncbi:hypothetical protein ACJRO7_012449 [Eucalyptus globulus]|uniref:Uncharacterized protein n=1 Tax=Eucalyptus globulus TaxID=34317 RepID=A0ABD3LM31_EUCGL